MNVSITKTTQTIRQPISFVLHTEITLSVYNHSLIGNKTVMPDKQHKHIWVRCSC